MRLTELDPRWLMVGGQRKGFVFKSPVSPNWWQSCMFAQTNRMDQNVMFNAALPDIGGDPDYAFTKVQGCNEQCGWSVTSGPVAEATFDNISVHPSIDGSAGGLWHGHVTDGEMKTV